MTVLKKVPPSRVRAETDRLRELRAGVHARIEAECWVDGPAHDPDSRDRRPSADVRSHDVEHRRANVESM
jgi:hypothetical protein